MATSTAKKPATKPGVAKARVTAAKVASPETAEGPDAPASEGKKSLSPQVNRKELVTRVVAALDGRKKGAVKEVVEATLAVLGTALQKGEALNLPPFGRARVAKQKGEGAASLTTLRLRGAGEKNAPKAGKQALAEVGEDD